MREPIVSMADKFSIKKFNFQPRAPLVFSQHHRATRATRASQLARESLECRPVNSHHCAASAKFRQPNTKGKSKWLFSKRSCRELATTSPNMDAQLARARRRRRPFIMSGWRRFRRPERIKINRERRFALKATPPLTNSNRPTRTRSMRNNAQNCQL